MHFYKGCSDGAFEMAEDWLVECVLCGHQHQIYRRSLNITVMKQGDFFEHYFWTGFFCKGCGEKMFVRTKIFGNEVGEFIREDHECDNAVFINTPVVLSRFAGISNHSSNRDSIHINNSNQVGGFSISVECVDWKCV